MHEVIAKMHDDFGNCACPNYGMFRVRGQELSITLGDINAYYRIDVQEEPNLNKIAMVLIKDERTSWVNQNMPFTILLTNYSLMYKIGIKKWLLYIGDRPAKPWASSCTLLATRER